MNRQMKRMQERAERAQKRAGATARPRPPPRLGRPPSRRSASGPGARQFLKEVRQELKKVDWPTRRELISYTIVVLGHDRRDDHVRVRTRLRVHEGDLQPARLTPTRRTRSDRRLDQTTDDATPVADALEASAEVHELADEAAEPSPDGGRRRGGRRARPPMTPPKPSSRRPPTRPGRSPTRAPRTPPRAWSPGRRDAVADRRGRRGRGRGDPRRGRDRGGRDRRPRPTSWARSSSTWRLPTRRRRRPRHEAYLEMEAMQGDGELPVDMATRPPPRTRPPRRSPSRSPPRARRGRSPAESSPPPRSKPPIEPEAPAPADDPFRRPRRLVRRPHLRRATRTR